MQLIKGETRSIGRDVNIKIPLAATSSLNGLQQAINDYVARESALSINAVTDGETYRFLYGDTDPKLFDYEFSNGGNYASFFTYAGFTTEEINNLADVFTNSFFIMQIYDSTVSENQTLLHNSYYNGFSFSGNTSEFNLDKTSEFMNLYIPEWFINENTGDTITVFATFLFYNAKTGKLLVFYNKDNESDTTEDKMYHDVILDVDYLNRNYTLPTGAMNMKELDNAQYTDKVNESISSFENQQPQYPEGKQFNADGTYTEVS